MEKLYAKRYLFCLYLFCLYFSVVHIATNDIPNNRKSCESVDDMNFEGTVLQNFDVDHSFYFM